MKVFLSHQKQDSALTAQIAHRLKHRHNIDAYLDVIDPFFGQGIDRLANHIRDEMGKCDQLLAVISPATARSQWVPWEVGMATEKDFPLATYSGGNVLPPEFLRSWPYLRSDTDLDAYAVAARASHSSFTRNRSVLSESVARLRSTSEFYSTLRTTLRQSSEFRSTN